MVSSAMVPCKTFAVQFHLGRSNLELNRWWSDIAVTIIRQITGICDNDIHVYYLTLFFTFFFSDGS